MIETHHIRVMRKLCSKLSNSPYARFGGMVRTRVPPAVIPSNPTSQPLITLPFPSCILNGAPEVFESKTLPLASLPMYRTAKDLPFFALAPLPTTLSSIVKPLGRVFFFGVLSPSAGEGVPCCCFCCFPSALEAVFTSWLFLSVAGVAFACWAGVAFAAGVGFAASALGAGVAFWLAAPASVLAFFASG